MLMPVSEQPAPRLPLRGALGDSHPRCSAQIRGKHFLLGDWPSVARRISIRNAPLTRVFACIYAACRGCADCGSFFR
jgi:hypothetical protein